MDLEELIHVGEMKSATEAAKRIGVSLKFLRTTFPNEHALLVQRGSDLAKAIRGEASETFDQVYLDEHKAL
ncbi:hypothetical protein, partial [Burkholderia sp. SIMBA_019]|uniref:hypothetical protein n=1 Tax=Burkholderia sp. SIMBA_019 TaxID=3085765 RepID=UPI00397952A9